MEKEVSTGTTFFRFEDLRVYHKSIEYINWTYKVLNSLPPEQVNGFASKFSKSAESIALNIAEGSARNKSQFIYHLKMAKSAIRECVVFTSVARNMDFFDEYQEEESRNILMEMTKMVGALIGSLQRSN